MCLELSHPTRPVGLNHQRLGAERIGRENVGGITIFVNQTTGSFSIDPEMGTDSRQQIRRKFPRKRVTICYQPPRNDSNDSRF
jgi:hypothetical protein